MNFSLIYIETQLGWDYTFHPTIDWVSQQTAKNKTYFLGSFITQLVAVFTMNNLLKTYRILELYNTAHYGIYNNIYIFSTSKQKDIIFVSATRKSRGSHLYPQSNNRIHLLPRKSRIHCQSQSCIQGPTLQLLTTCSLNEQLPAHCSRAHSQCASNSIWQC